MKIGASDMIENVGRPGRRRDFGFDLSMVLRGEASLGESVVDPGKDNRGPLASVPTQH
jgi:hypothetical protein